MLGTQTLLTVDCLLVGLSTGKCAVYRLNWPFSRIGLGLDLVRQNRCHRHSQSLTDCFRPFGSGLSRFISALGPSLTRVLPVVASRQGC